MIVNIRKFGVVRHEFSRGRHEFSRLDETNAVERRSSFVVLQEYSSIIITENYM